MKKSKLDILKQYGENYPQWDIQSLMFILGWDETIRIVKKAIQAGKDIEIRFDDDKDDGQTVHLVKKK